MNSTPTRPPAPDDQRWPLIEDVFTLLAFLRSRDIAPVHSRFLPVSALASLCPFMTVPDPIDAAPIRGERNTHRLRFVHFLCEASRLVARTGRYLKPTPDAMRWLALPDAGKLSMLFTASLLADSRPAATVWQAYRLPFWRALRTSSSISTSTSSSSRVAPGVILLDAFRTYPDRWLTNARLLKAMPVAGLDDAAEAERKADLGILLGYLQWFGAVERGPRGHIRLTSLGTALCNHQLPAQMATGATAGATCPITLELSPEWIFTAAAGWEALFELHDYAELVEVMPRRRYRLDQALIRRALDRRATLTYLVHFFTRLLGADSLPEPVASFLTQTARRSGRVTVRRVTLLETDDADTMRAIAGDWRARTGLGRFLSPQSATVRSDRLKSLLRRLARLGLPARIDAHDAPPAGTRPFDQPTLAYLYLSARLCHTLSSAIPDRYRPPYSVVLDLERRLSEHDRLVAGELAEECARLLEARATAPLTGDGDLPESVARHLDQLAQAIDDGASVILQYLAVATHSVTTRRVDPLHLEWRNQRPYLTAYCHTSQANRTFRVDRIMAVE